MSFTTGNLWVIVLACGFIGFIVGLMAANTSHRREKEEIEQKLAQTEEALKAAKERFAALQARPPDYDLAVGHDKPGEGLWVELNRNRYHKLAELNPELYQQISKQVGDLQAWLHLSTAQLRPGVQPAAQPIPQKSEPAPKVEAVPETPIMPAVAPPPKPNPLNVNLDLAGRISKAISPKTAPKPPEPKSMVAQIDEILQEKIAGTPLEDKGLKLVETPGHGVMVTLGLEKYQGIDAVPDPHVQALIRSAVAEWEKRNG